MTGMKIEYNYSLFDDITTAIDRFFNPPQNEELNKAIRKELSK